MTAKPSVQTYSPTEAALLVALYRAKARGVTGGVKSMDLGRAFRLSAYLSLQAMGLMDREITNLPNQPPTPLYFLNTKGWREGFRVTKLEKGAQR